jgi:hypothetical protein
MEEFKLYTLVDITHTQQYRPSAGILHWQEQNFNTVLQTLGIRSNVIYNYSPDVIETRGSLVGFNTEEIIRVWRFDFYTERESVYKKNDDPVGLLKEDFTLIPYIAGLNEAMEQKYAVFNPEEPGNNISFFKK